MSRLRLARSAITQLSRTAACQGSAGRCGPSLTAPALWAASAACQAVQPPAAVFAATALITGVRSESTQTQSSMSVVDKNLLIDTLGLMRRFERLGMSRRQAEQLTTTVTEVLCENREKLADSYVSKGVLEKTVLEQEARIAGFRAEVLKSQELQAATFTRDTERLQSNLEKIRSEIRYEIDKLTASQRLDLNLEKGRMRDELQMLRDKANELEIKVDKEVNSLKAAMEQSKNDTVKYVLGLLLALVTAGLGVARIII